jgi:cytochrome c oxidase cbb3-type subunit 3
MAVCRSQRTRWAIIAVVLVCAVIAIGVYGGRDTLGPSAKRDLSRRGPAVYNYHCYQCHGYAGDAKTLASTYLDPKPRDFTRASPATLTREAMLDAVRRGRPGTAMAAFGNVLAAEDIVAVTDFVRTTFMISAPPEYRYHTAANGWPDHERYTAAFPFVTGELPLETAWAELAPLQRAGKRLFMSACITCHDRGRPRAEGPVWGWRAVSYPRLAKGTPELDADSGGSPYHLHEKPPAFSDLSAAEARGQQLYMQNCAFCHAADGAGRNWIGSFLEPRPRDLTGARVGDLARRRQLKQAIEEGLPGTTMPAWQQVLNAEQIDDLIAYLKRAFIRSRKDEPRQLVTASERRSERLEWRREPRNGR